MIAKAGARTALAWLLLGTAVPQGQADPKELVPVELRVAFTRPSFIGVNEADAMAAFRVFTLRMGEKRGYEITAVIRVFDSLEELRAEIERGTVRLLIIDSWDYLTLDPGPTMPAVFIAVEQGVVAEEYLLLARAGSGFEGLEDLKGKRVVVLESSQANTGRQWLETQLLELGVSRPETYFGSYEILSRTAHVVLPVYFGNADACLVDRSGYEVMAEMNPQVGEVLRVVSRSQPIVDTVACVRQGGWADEKQREDLLAALEEISSDPAGEQILRLFKFDGFTRFKNEHLNTVRALKGRYEAAKTRAAMQSNGGEPR